MEETKPITPGTIEKSNAMKSTEQTLAVCMLLDEVSVQAQANRDVIEVLQGHPDTFVELVNDIQSMSARRNNKVKELASVLGRKIVLLAKRKIGSYGHLESLREKLKQRESGIRRLSMTSPSLPLNENDIRIGEEFETDLSILMNALGEHEKVSALTLDDKKWESMDSWTGEEVEAADRRIRADTEWYTRYNERLEHTLLHENIDSLIQHLKEIQKWNGRLLNRALGASGLSLWAKSELKDRLSRASTKVQTEWTDTKRTAHGVAENLTDNVLLTVKNHAYMTVKVLDRKLEQLFLSFVDGLAGRLASETVMMNELFNRIDKTKEDIFERTKAYRKLISFRQASFSKTRADPPSESKIAAVVHKTEVNEPIEEEANDGFSQDVHSEPYERPPSDDSTEVRAWLFIKMNSEDQFRLRYCVLWNNLILYIFEDMDAADRFFDGKASSARVQKFLDLTMGISLRKYPDRINDKECTVFEIKMSHCFWMIGFSSQKRSSFWYERITSVIDSSNSSSSKKTDKKERTDSFEIVDRGTKKDQVVQAHGWLELWKDRTWTRKYFAIHSHSIIFWFKNAEECSSFLSDKEPKVTNDSVNLEYIVNVRRPYNSRMLELIFRDRSKLQVRAETCAEALSWLRKLYQYVKIDNIEKIASIRPKPPRVMTPLSKTRPSVGVVPPPREQRGEFDQRPWMAGKTRLLYQGMESSILCSMEP